MRDGLVGVVGFGLEGESLLVLFLKAARDSEGVLFFFK